MSEINCDQVAWLLDIFNRYLPHDKFPAISRQREMKKYGMLYEVMEIAHLDFQDDRARWNGTPNEARDYGEDNKKFPGAIIGNANPGKIRSAIPQPTDRQE